MPKGQKFVNPFGLTTPTACRTMTLHPQDIVLFMILVVTGNGKGKTTSALGTALRAAGWNKRVAIVFFDKGGNHYGEQKMLGKFSKAIDVFRFGLPRFDEKSKTFRFDNTPGDLKQAEEGVKKILELYGKDYFLIVCDELINALNLGLVSESKVQEVVEKCPPMTHLLLTGRGAPAWLTEKADLVSEIKEMKHYFRSGQDATKGLDY
ncbi:MAG: cob(I)yrinic acid a,c-diamide adenosyltransferase [Candidatus Peregrinibacteria bacterium]